MGIFDGCLLASDIDGTLLASGYLPQRNIDAVEYFVSQGGAFSLATGRSIGAVSSVTAKIKKLSPSVTCNGAVIYDYNKRKILHSVGLCDKDKQVISEIKMRFPSVGIELHSGEEVLTLTRSEATDLHQQYEDLPTKTVTFDDIAEITLNKALLAFDSPRQRDETAAFLKTADADGDFVNTTAEIGGEIKYYCELLPRGVSKAAGLEILCKMLNIKKGCYFAIGDYYNDLEMLKAADASAVPEESPDDIKAVADTVVGGVRNGAVADFIEYIKQRLTAEGGKTEKKGCK